jgi:hypothetical protein
MAVHRLGGMVRYQAKYNGCYSKTYYTGRFDCYIIDPSHQEGWQGNNGNPSNMGPSPEGCFRYTPCPYGSTLPVPLVFYDFITASAKSPHAMYEYRYWMHQLAHFQDPTKHYDRDPFAITPPGVDPRVTNGAFWNGLGSGWLCDVANKRGNC